MSSPQRLFLGFSLSLASVFLALALSETLVRFIAFSAESRRQGAAQLWRAYESEYVRPVNVDNDCSYIESLTPHPYFGNVHHRQPPCGQPGSNNIGFLDRGDFPLERDPAHFTVALLGGSVANHLAIGRLGSGVWLEEELNRKYRSPNGKPFRILAGSIGGWSLPNQITFLSLYGRSIDAAVAVDGFNEAGKTSWGLSIFRPDPLTALALTRSPQASWYSRLVSLPYRLRHLALENVALKRSFLLYFLFDRSYRMLGASDGALKKAQWNLTDRFFTLPSTWDYAKREQWNQERYAEYIRSLRNMAGALGIEYAHFVQPARLVDKPLTEEEKQFRAQIVPEHYRNVYVRTSESLAKEGVHTRSLTSIFRNETGTIYSDDVHCRYDPESWENPGYRKMSAAIADYLAQFWHLRRK